MATPHACLHCHLQYPANALTHRGELLAYITSDRIRSNAQLDGALDYLGKVIGSGVQARTGWKNGECRLACMSGCRRRAAHHSARSLHTLLIGTGFPMPARGLPT